MRPLIKLVATTLAQSPAVQEAALFGLYCAVGAYWTYVLLTYALTGAAQ